ncbi:hypothetical protein SUGI_0626310 [Cryptomeria japonica]|nr:hypothetical protein SUGI_0626310 [Cryptomeria japonica]
MTCLSRMESRRIKTHVGQGLKGNTLWCAYPTHPKRSPKHSAGQHRTMGTLHCNDKDSLILLVHSDPRQAQENIEVLEAELEKIKQIMSSYMRNFVTCKIIQKIGLFLEQNGVLTT